MRPITQLGIYLSSQHLHLEFWELELGSFCSPSSCKLVSCTSQHPPALSTTSNSSRAVQQMQGWRKLPSLSSKPCWSQGDLHTSRTPRLTNHQTRVSVRRSGAPPNRQQSRLHGCFTCTTLCCAATNTTCSTIAADGWHVAARHCRPASCQPRRTACSNEHAVCTMSN